MKRILVIDDEVAIAELLSEILEQEGYAVATAHNGLEGLERLQQVRPDLVLLDMMMPILDGRSVLAAIRAARETRSIPVVILSAGRVDQESQQEAVRVFAKPFELEELLETLHGTLEQPARPTA